MKIRKQITLLILLFIGTSMAGQNLSDPIPIDPSIKTGTLENGLKYFIKHNPKSENKAELRLAINAGSILETEEQRGLAHFLEHMAFNGTKNFEKNDLIDYLENLGVRFGADLNAHTSFDETVYKLTLPTDDSEVYDKGFEILRDWSDGMTLSEEDIDEERGVVAEELRSGLVGARRLFNSYVPLITNNSRYADRLPIGKLDVILNSDYQRLSDFYEDWYRPDLMAVIIVGDINVEETEAKIKSTFSGLENPEAPKPRDKYGIPDEKELQAGVFTDPEVENFNFYAYYRNQKIIPETLDEYRDILINNLYTGMLNQRMAEAREEGRAQVLGLGSGIGSFLADKDTYFVSVNLKEEFIEEGIKAALGESERAKKFGFTSTELERYKKRILNNANTRRKEEGKINSRSYVEDYIEYFIEGSPIPSSEFTYEFYKKQLPKISLEEVNKVADEWITDENITLVLAGPEKENLNLPEKDELIKWFNEVKKSDLEPYEDDLIASELMEDQPVPGEIISESYNDDVNITELKLSNGVTVVLKPTELQNDIINLRAYRPGGSSLAPDENYISARYAGDIINQSGINNISNSGLRKLNMGKTVNLRTYINFYEELISGNSSNEDLETLFQLAHLHFTMPNKDEQSFKTFKERQIASYKNDDLNPLRYFNKEIAKEISNNHLRAISVTSEQIEKELDLDKAYDFYKERYASANGFKLFFVGNFEVENIKPLIKKYIASLPGEEIEDEAKDIGLRYTQGKNITYHRGSEDKADVHLRYTDDFDYSLENKKLFSALSHVIRLRLYEELREKRGGVYGVRVSSFANDIPYEWFRQGVEFTCAPDKVDELIEVVKNEIKDIQENGISEDNLNKVQEAQRLQGKEGLDYNGYWSSKLKEAYQEDLDPKGILDYNAFPDSLTSDKLQELAKKYLTEDKLSQFVLLPEEE